LAAPLDGSEPQDSPASIFTAMSELGLRLAAGKAPVDVLVVESIRRPTENWLHPVSPDSHAGSSLLTPPDETFR
jgi:hypothetical protein